MASIKFTKIGQNLVIISNFFHHIKNIFSLSFSNLGTISYKL